MTQDVPENTDGAAPAEHPSAGEAPAAERDAEALRAERDALIDAIESAVGEEMARIPTSRRSLVPQNLEPADKLVYLLKNRELLRRDRAESEATVGPAPAFAGQKPLAEGRLERPWTDLTYPEKVRLAKERPDQFRRIRETHLGKNIVATR